MSGSNIFFENNNLDSQTFTASGTFNVPDGVSQVFIELYGGGGGGTAGGVSIVNQSRGGEGAKPVYQPVSVTPGGTVTITIGAGGVGGTSGVPGGDGGDSSFGSVIARGARGGNITLSDFALPGGSGHNGNKGIGGTKNGSFSSPGDGSYGNGGNSDTSSPTNGGFGAGGGGVDGTNTGGNGGSGICIVYWKKD